MALSLSPLSLSLSFMIRQEPYSILQIPSYKTWVLSTKIYQMDHHSLFCDCCFYTWEFSVFPILLGHFHLAGDLIDRWPMQPNQQYVQHAAHDSTKMGPQDGDPEVTVIPEPKYRTTITQWLWVTKILWVREDKLSSLLWFLMHYYNSIVW